VEERASIDATLAAYESRVYTYFRRMAPGRGDVARDLTQETFYRALRDLDAYRGDSSFATWLLGIAHNVFREWLRKARRESVVAEPVPSRTDASADTRDLDVIRILNAMDAGDREVLVLRFVLDLAGQDVAHLLGLSHDALRQRVARAKLEFRKLWVAE
jgi:RNA polymerase sigma-70 factor (ECF subfamily)